MKSQYWRGRKPPSASRRGKGSPALYAETARRMQACPCDSGLGLKGGCRLQARAASPNTFSAHLFKLCPLRALGFDSDGASTDGLPLSISFPLVDLSAASLPNLFVRLDIAFNGRLESCFKLRHRCPVEGDGVIDIDHPVRIICRPCRSSCEPCKPDRKHC